MVESNVILEYVQALKDKDIVQVLALLAEKIGIRDTKKNLYLDLKSAEYYFTKLFENDLDNIYFEQEDSHYLVYYTNKSKFISKVTINENHKIEKIVEEIIQKNLDRIVMVIEYDGTDYKGMQKQDEYASIQEALELALHKMLNQDIHVVSASRTDAGVHAKHQVVHFDYYGVEPGSFKYALNNILPGSIRIIDAYKRSQLFHARYDVVKKEYQYVIDMGEKSVFSDRYVWYKKIYNLAFLKEELRSIEGTHDFTTFSKGLKDDLVRTIYHTNIEKKGNRVIISIVGSGFLRNMIRLIIGELVDMNVNDAGNLLKLVEAKDRNLSKKLAPASGLFLVSIEY